MSITDLKSSFRVRSSPYPRKVVSPMQSRERQSPMPTLIAPTSDSTAFSPQFDLEGVLVVDPLVSPGDIDTLTLRTAEIAAGSVPYPDEHLELEPGATGLELSTLRKINHCHFHDEVFAAHAAHPGILDVIEALIGPDIKVFGSQLFMKPPGGVEKPWHQDSAYFPLDPQIVVTCWTALDNVTLENGCMHVIVGSHRDGIIDHSQEWMIGDRRDMQVPDELIDENRTRAITLAAGGCSFHHGILLHRSGPNHTAHSRRGLAVHYIPGNCRWIGPPEEEKEFQVVRGRDTTN